METPKTTQPKVKKLLVLPAAYNKNDPLYIGYVEKNLGYLPKVEPDAIQL